MMGQSQRKIGTLQISSVSKWSPAKDSSNTWPTSPLSAPH